MKSPPKINRKRFLTCGIVIVALVSLSVVGSRYNIGVISGITDVVTYPFKKVITVATQHIGGVFSYFQNIDELIAENEELQATNYRLSYENAILEQFKTENDKLKALLDMSQRYEEYPSQAANIIGKDPGNWYEVFIIDKGLINGISQNDVILAEGALVGHITQLDPLSATVLSIIDDRSYASVEVVRSGAVGILTGEIELVDEGLARMEVDINADIVAGDQIITSYLSDIYPPGIPVGEVREVSIGDNGLVQYAYVNTIVDFDRLRNVLIISPNK